MYDEKNVREISGTLLDFNSMASTIKIKSADGKQRFSRIMSSKTVKINLKPDKRYYIEVSYDGNGTWLKYARLRNARMEGNPYWYVSATHKVKSYW